MDVGDNLDVFRRLERGEAHRLRASSLWIKSSSADERPSLSS